jgi:hypothetical protein
LTTSETACKTMPKIPKPKKNGAAVGSGTWWRPAAEVATPTATLTRFTANDTMNAIANDRSNPTMIAARIVPGSALMRSQANVSASPGANVRPPGPVAAAAP